MNGKLTAVSVVYQPKGLRDIFHMSESSNISIEGRSPFYTGLPCRGRCCDNNDPRPNTDRGSVQSYTCTSVFVKDLQRCCLELQHGNGRLADSVVDTFCW